MKYYITIKDNLILDRGTTYEDAELNTNQKEISEELYSMITVPATFELDEEGNIINIKPLTQLEPEPIVVDEEIDEEKIAMAEAIIDLNKRLGELEDRLNGGA